MLRIVAPSLFLLAAPAVAQQFPEVEPNNSVGQAVTIPLGQQCNANIDVAADEDWYTFTTPGGYHLISVTGAFDAVMFLYDATGTTQLALCDDGQGNLPSYWGNIAAGTYTIKVRAFSATTTGAYALDVSNPASKPLNTFEVEPNDTLATAKVVVDGDQIGASLSTPTTVLLSSVAPATVVTTNSVASSTTTSITVAVPQTAGTWNGTGYFVRMTSGANAGLARRITANTTTSITTEAWPVAQAAADTFEVITHSVSVLSDVVAASSTTVITATTPLVASAYTPSGSHAVRMTSGVNAGLSRTITSNTATTITTNAWPAANSPGDTFEIVVGGGTNSVIAGTPLTAGQFNDQRHWLRCTSGANAGQTRCILSNTASYMLLVSSFTNAPAPGDTYEIDQYDSDLYRFDVTAPRALVVFSVTDGDLPWVGGWSYEVLDVAGNRVDASTLATNLADSGAFNPRVSSFRVWPTGTYYVRIFQRRTIPTTTLPTQTSGNYRFEVKIRNMNVGGVVAEAAEPNNTAFTATPINLGQQGVGTITNSGGADASDWWGPITVNQQSLICFQTANGSAPSIGDTTINLYQLLDPALGTVSAPSAVTSGNILEGAGTSHARGTFNFLLPGTIYYLEVVSPGAAANQAGNYLLEISELDVPTYAAGNYATATANATGCGTAGVPAIARVLATELPIVGQTFATRVSNLNGAGNFGLLVIGTGGASGPVYNPQPVDLTPVGAPGCTLNVNPLFLEILLGDASGNADYVVPCPGNLSLTGATLFLQPAKWDFSLNALGVQPGGWMRVIFGTRAF